MNINTKDLVIEHNDNNFTVLHIPSGIIFTGENRKEAVDHVWTQVFLRLFPSMK